MVLYPHPTTAKTPCMRPPSDSATWPPFPTGHTRRMHSLPSVWTDALAQWVTALRAAGRSETTIGSYLERVALLAKWAARSGQGPWSLSGDNLIEFSGSQRWATETRRGSRNAITGFYAWGHGTGRIPHDPSAALPRVVASINSRRPAPDSAILKAWEHASPPMPIPSTRLASRLNAEIKVVEQKCEPKQNEEQQPTSVSVKFHKS